MSGPATSSVTIQPVLSPLDFISSVQDGDPDIQTDLAAYGAALGEVLEYSDDRQRALTIIELIEAITTKFANNPRVQQHLLKDLAGLLAEAEGDLQKASFFLPWKSRSVTLYTPDAEMRAQVLSVLSEQQNRRGRGGPEPVAVQVGTAPLTRTRMLGLPEIMEADIRETVAGKGRCMPTTSMMGGSNGCGGNSGRTRAAEVFERFLSRNSAERGTISEDGISVDTLIPNAPKGVDLSEFRAIDDTLLYSDLLTRLVARFLPHNGPVTVIDLGAGSSIPTIRALLSNPLHRNVRVVAVDNSAVAIETSQRNIGYTGLSDRYTLVNNDMLAFLRSRQFEPGDVIVANPPYLPIAPHMVQPYYVPVNGGVDGSNYLRTILDLPVPAGTIVALEWSSLSNPSEVIRRIEEKYEVLYVTAHKAPFGSYTGSSPLKEYLESQREYGLSVFDTDGNQHFFTFVGCIIKRR